MDLLRLLPVASRDAVYRLLQDCIKRRDLAAGRYAYSLIITAGLDSIVVLQDLLIRLFAFCGKLEEANVVFDRVSNPSVHTWNAIISANTELENPERAFALYHKMRQRGMEPNKFIFLSILRLCSSTKALEQGRMTHKEIRESGLLSDVFVGNTVVDMYIKCKSLDEAREVFDILSRDVVSWSIMISGYVHSGHISLAVELFLELQHEGIMPNEVIFVCMAKLCPCTGILELMHSQIVEGGYEVVAIIANVLIDMYAKFRNLVEALRIFERLLERDVASWGTLIAGLVQHGQGLNALEHFDKLLQEGFYPSNVIYASTIKACSSIGALEKGKLVHSQIIWSGHKSDLVIGNCLVDMYAKCSSVDEARQVFNSLLVRDDVSWGAMFSVYAQQGHDLAALNLLERMHEEGMEPNKVVYLSILKACGSLEAISNGRQIHDQIVARGLHCDDVVVGALIDMYVKCGSLDEAHKVFDSLPSQDIVSWGALIAGYTQHSHFFSAFELLQKMQLHGLKPDSFMFLSVLKANDSTIAEEECRLLHRQIIYWGYEMNLPLGNSLIHVYGKNGDVEGAHKVFDDLSNRNDLSWILMMAVYTENGHALSGIKHCVRMHQEGISMDRIMLVYALKAHGIIGELLQGRLLHRQVVRDGFESDVVVGSTLIDMYSNCGCLHDAFEVFNKLPIRNMVTYGAMIAGYVRHGLGLAALKLFASMRLEGIEPTEATCLCCLKACGIVGALSQGRIIHKEIFMIEQKSVFFGSTLMDMYAKCGSLEDACRVFEDMSTRNAVTWELMISIYAQHGHGHSALESFERMKNEGFEPRGPTFLCALNACGDIGALGYGRVIHDQIIRRESSSDVVLENAIIDCYARCGSMGEAHVVFDKLQIHNVVSWSALIQGYSNYGDAGSARWCLEAMEQEGLKLNEPAFTNILAACRHSGLLEEACHHFKCMKETHGITPTAEHYNCLIDLLSRSGYLQEAKSLLESMHIPPDIVAWRSLLTCCTNFQDTEGSLRCFSEVSRLDPVNGSAYALMSNIHTNTDNPTFVSKSPSMKGHTYKHSKSSYAETTERYREGSKSQIIVQDYNTIGKQYEVTQFAVSFCRQIYCVFVL